MDLHAFYVCVGSHCQTTVVDLRDFDWTEEEWDQLSEAQQTSVLTEIFKELQGNLCDSGWYPVKNKSEINPEEIV